MPPDPAKLHPVLNAELVPAKAFPNADFTASTAQKLCLFALWAHENERITRRRIEDLTGLSRSSAQRAMLILEHRGMIKRTVVKGRGRQRCSVYLLDLDALNAAKVDTSLTRKGRPHGVKLNPAKAAEIRRLRRIGHRPSDLARRFGVTQNTIYKITSGQLWKDAQPA